MKTYKSKTVQITILFLYVFTPFYLVDAQDEAKFVLQNGHTSSVETVVFSPDGKTLASGSWDNTIKLWHLGAGKLITTLHGHSSGVEAVAFSKDGRTLASGGWDKTIKVWDIHTGKLISTFQGHASGVEAVAFSNDGKTLASGSWDNSIKLWDLGKGTLITTLQGHSSDVEAVVWSPDGKILVSGSWDKTIKLWDTGTGKLIKTLYGHTDPVEAVTFSKDGKIVVSGSWDKTLKLWNTLTGELINTLQGDSSNVAALVFSPDGKTIASGNSDNTIALWDLVTGELINTLQGHASNVVAVAFSPDGKTLASGSRDHTIKLWDMAAGKLMNTLQEHAFSVNDVTCSPDGKTLASGSQDKTIKLWDIGTGRLINTLEGHTFAVNAMAYSPDGKILASGSRDHTVMMWDIVTGKQINVLRGHSLSVEAVAFSPDGKTLASGSRDNTIKLWDMSKGKLLYTIQAHSFSVNALAFSMDGQLLASGSSDHTVKLWDRGTGELITVLQGHSLPVETVLFSPVGNTLVSGSQDSTIKLWDASIGELITTLQEHSSAVLKLAFSPDGKTLASGSGDNTIKVWDIGKGKVLNTLQGHTSSVQAAAFSPDGKILVSGSSDAGIKLWNTQNGVLLANLYGFKRGYYMSFTPQGYYVSSKESEKFAAWRIGNNVYTFNQYAYRLNKPDMVEKSIAGENSTTPDFNLAIHTPPELLWIKNIENTSNNLAEIAVHYKSNSNLFNIMAFHNNQPLTITTPQKTNDTTIVIPLALFSYNNSLQIVATNTDTLSTFLNTNFIYTSGLGKPEPYLEYTFQTEIPFWLKVEKALTVNGRRVKIIFSEEKPNTIQFLGENIFKSGLNRIVCENEGFLLWHEDGKLINYSQPYKNSFAVISAIDDYDRKLDPKKRTPTGYKELINMKDNAKLLIQSLQQFGFPKENIITLFDTNATSTALEDSLKLFWTGGKYAHADHLFFYFGGHSDTLKKDIPYLVTYDYNKSSPLLTSFLMEDLGTRHSRYIHAHHVLFALDACHSGLALFESMNMDSVDRERLDKFKNLSILRSDTERPARNLLLAGTDEQRALWVTGGIFTKALVNALNMQSDYNQDGIIDFDELAHYVCQEVTYHAKRLDVRQDPASYILSEKGKCVFVPAK